MPSDAHWKWDWWGEGNLSEILTSKKLFIIMVYVKPCQKMGLPNTPPPRITLHITETTNIPYFTLKFYNNVLLLLAWKTNTCNHNCHLFLTSITLSDLKRKALNVHVLLAQINEPNINLEYKKNSFTFQVVSIKLPRYCILVPWVSWFSKKLKLLNLTCK